MQAGCGPNAYRVIGFVCITFFAVYEKVPLSASENASVPAPTTDEAGAGANGTAENGGPCNSRMSPAYVPAAVLDANIASQTGLPLASSVYQVR